MLSALNKLLACKNLPIGFKKMAAVLHLRPIGKCLGLQALHSVHTLLIWWLIWCRLNNDLLQGTYCILSSGIRLEIRINATRYPPCPFHKQPTKHIDSNQI